MREITLEASIDNIERVTAFVDAFLEEIDCPMKANMQIDIAVDEIFGNIAHYAYTPGTGEATVSVDYNEETGEVSLCFRDRGVPYDPLKKDDPDVTLSADERQIGGLGIYMVKKSMDSMSYTYADGQNILTVTKKL